MAWRVAEMIYFHRDGNEEMFQMTFHSETIDLEGRSLSDYARLLGHVEIQKMTDEFAAFYLLFDLHQQISHSYASSELRVENKLSKFSGEDPCSVAWRLIRFSAEFLDANIGHARTLRPIRSEIASLVERGHASVVTWLVQADPSLVDSLKAQSIHARVNINEFLAARFKDIQRVIRGYGSRLPGCSRPWSL
jgi:hypothetical protein